MVRPAQPADVVGRRTELDAVAALLEAVPRGVAGLLIQGDAGIGKTTLWRAGLAAAQERGYRVLACQPAEAEAQLSFAAMADLLDPVLTDVLADLPIPQRRGLETALLRTESDAPADERAVAFGLLSVLRLLARSDPVLVAVDDWQWLDTASAPVLRFALRRLDAERVGLLATVRTAAGGDIGAGLERDLGEARLTRLELEPFTLAALHELLATHAGLSIPRRTLLKIHRATAGNMVFALEIARVLADRDEPLPPGEDLPVPATLSELVGHRVAALPSSTRDVLLSAAALTQPTIGVLQALDPRQQPATVLAAAERADLVVLDGERVRFSHPLIAAAVYTNSSPERRQQLHRRLAQMVTEPEERARHLALAADGPSEAVAEALAHAAASARLRGAPDAAAELCELAAAAIPPEQSDMHRRRLFDAAEHYFVAGDRQRARRLLEQILKSSPPGDERATVLRLLAEVRYNDDSFPEAAQLLRQALAEVGDDSGERAVIHFNLGYVSHACERLAVGAEHTRAAVAPAEEYGDEGLLAEVLASATMVDFLMGHGLDDARLHRALAKEDVTRRTPTPSRPSAIYGAAMSWMGRSAEAQACLEGLRARLLELGDEAALPFMAFILSPTACARGDLSAARRHAEEGLEAAQVGTDVMRAYALTAMAYADAYSGRTDRAITGAAQAVALLEKAGGRGWVAQPLSALAFAHLSLDDAAAAARVLRPELDALPTAGVQEPGYFQYVPDAVQALIMLGDLETAGPVLDWFEWRGQILDRPWALATGRRCRGLLRAARGDLDGGLATLDESIGIHKRLHHPVDLARTLLIRGQLQRRANQRRNAQASLEQARGIFEEVGSVQWSQRASAELTRLGLHHAAGRHLTPRERQVAEGAAGGATNNQIAAALHIRPKTVEANLSRAYAKLGISSRAELGAWLAAQRGGQEPPA